MQTMFSAVTKNYKPKSFFVIIVDCMKLANFTAVSSRHYALPCKAAFLVRECYSNMYFSASIDYLTIKIIIIIEWQY